MPGFLPENPGVIKMDVIPEIRRLHFVEGVTITDLAKQFKNESSRVGCIIFLEFGKLCGHCWITPGQLLDGQVVGLIVGKAEVVF